MEHFEELKHLIRLKEIQRSGEINGRPESSAEHTWATLIIAEHFMKVVKEPLDELRVMKLILFHDLVEIEAGDVDMLDDEARYNKKDRELEAFRKLKPKIPSTIKDDYHKYFEEFEAQETMEAKFARAMDKIEPMLHWALYHPKKIMSHGWTETKVREKWTIITEPFPELKKFAEEWIQVMKKDDHL